MHYFYRRPGWVRMEFIQPHRGMVLIYDPGTGRVHLWPFGPKRVLVLTFTPDSPVLRNQRGHRVDRSDVGALLANLRALRAAGSMSLLDGAEVAGRPVTVLDIVGSAGVTIAGVHRYRVSLARRTLFPTRADRFALGGVPLETRDIPGVET